MYTYYNHNIVLCKFIVKKVIGRKIKLLTSNNNYNNFTLFKKLFIVLHVYKVQESLQWNTCIEPLWNTCIYM